MKYGLSVEKYPLPSPILGQWEGGGGGVKIQNRAGTIPGAAAALKAMGRVC